MSRARPLSSILLHFAFQALQKWQNILGDASRGQPQMLRHTPPRDLSPAAHDIVLESKYSGCREKPLTQILQIWKLDWMTKFKG
jgi:hypothetical protein